MGREGEADERRKLVIARGGKRQQRKRQGQGHTGRETESGFGSENEEREEREQLKRGHSDCILCIVFASHAGAGGASTQDGQMRYRYVAGGR